MKTDTFKKILYLINFDIHNDGSVFKEILKYENDVMNEILDSFEDELDSNIQEKETTSGKTDVIKYYIHKLWDLQGVYRENWELLNDSNLRKKYKTVSISELEKDFDEFYTKYLFCSYDLFEYIIFDIQTICQIYEIDFYQSVKN